MRYSVSVTIEVTYEPEVDTSVAQGDAIEVGEITVTADGASFTPKGSFADLGITAKPGSDVWTAVLNKLPAAGYSTDLQKNVVYKYSVEETVSDGFDLVDITESAAAGGKLVAVNKLKAGQLEIKKVVEGAVPQDKTYEIAVMDSEGNYYKPDGTNMGPTPFYVTFSANGTQKWDPLTPGTYTVSEKNASVEGYTWTVSGTGAVRVEQGETAETTVTNSYFKDTHYTPKVTKSLKAGDEVVSDWPDGANFDFYLSFVEGYQESGSDKVALSRNDIVMSNREATATEDNKTANFELKVKDPDTEAETVQPGITFKKPGTYVFTIEEVEPAGTQNHKHNGIEYSTTPVTLTVVVGEKDGAAGELEVTKVTYDHGNDADDLDKKAGLITNKMDYPSYAPSVTKSLKNGENDASLEDWQGKSFTFNLAMADSMSVEQKANVIMPGTAQKTVTSNSPNHKETFDAISFKAEGVYTFNVTEQAGIDPSIKYDTSAKEIKVHVEPDYDGNLSVTKVTIGGQEITGDAIVGSAVTVVNTIITKTDLEFEKQWIDFNQQTIEWDQDIQVTVSRNRANGTKDNSFSLVYSVTKNAVNAASGEPKTAEFTATNPKEGDPKLQLTITEEGNTKKYQFKIEGLAYSGEEDGVYTYYVEETNSQLTGYTSPSYSNTSQPTGGTVAYTGGTIINKQVGGYELPQTGGIGTTLFTALGGLMTATAGAILTMKSYRRRKENA